MGLESFVYTLFHVKNLHLLFKEKKKVKERWRKEALLCLAVPGQALAIFPLTGRKTHCRKSQRIVESIYSPIFPIDLLSDLNKEWSEHRLQNQVLDLNPDSDP